MVIVPVLPSLADSLHERCDECVVDGKGNVFVGEYSCSNSLVPAVKAPTVVELMYSIQHTVSELRMCKVGNNDRTTVKLIAFADGKRVAVARAESLADACAKLALWLLDNGYTFPNAYPSS